jgi:hypothetical protein
MASAQINPRENGTAGLTGRDPGCLQGGSLGQQITRRAVMACAR